MNHMKTFAFIFAVLLIGGALLYSLGSVQQQGEKLVLYDNFAYYEQNAKLSGSDFRFELPAGVERNSITLRLASGYVVMQHVDEANSTNEAALLRSYVGKDVSVFDSNGKEIRGTLLKYDGKAYVNVGSTLYVITPTYFSLLSFHGNMTDENASVSFRLNSTGGDARLSYLMDSISWSPDYTLYLNGNGGTVSLYGAVSNNAKDYDNVSLSLFYGQVKRNTAGYYYPSYNYASGSNYYAEKALAPAPVYTPTAVAEYYKFDLGNVALRQGESKYNLLEKAAALVKKTYEMQISGSNDNEALSVMLAMNNSESNGLGIPMPSGNIRVMDIEGFIGESSISDTPKGEEMKFSIGNAFDIIGSSKLVNQTTDENVNCAYGVSAENAPLCVKETGYITTSTYAYEATVKNKKGEDAAVVLSYSPYGDWTMVSESMPSEKVSQNLVQWKFNVPADSEKTLRFTLRIKTGHPPIYYSSPGVAKGVSQ